MQRLIVTGANGSGKSLLATRLGAVRKDVPVVSYDALRLTTGWQRQSEAQVEAELAGILAQEKWIIEGGPSLVPRALDRAHGVIWLDPPETVRAWRLFTRPWQNRGKTRAELPPGNEDRILEQYRFAWNSLRAGSDFRNEIAAQLAKMPDSRVWRCRTEVETERAIKLWIGAG